MQQDAAGISTELRDRYGVQPEVSVNVQNGSALHVSVTLPLSAVRPYTAEQLHAHVMDVATKHLDKRPDNVYLVIASSP